MSPVSLIFLSFHPFIFPFRLLLYDQFSNWYLPTQIEAQISTRSLLLSFFSSLAFLSFASVHSFKAELLQGIKKQRPEKLVKSLGSCIQHEYAQLFLWSSLFFFFFIPPSSLQTPAIFMSLMSLEEESLKPGISMWNYSTELLFIVMILIYLTLLLFYSSLHLFLAIHRFLLLF